MNEKTCLFLIFDLQNTLSDTNSIFSAYDIITPVNLVFLDLLINIRKINRKSGKRLESGILGVHQPI